jgi:hypothetical protein
MTATAGDFGISLAPISSIAVEVCREMTVNRADLPVGQNPRDFGDLVRPDRVKSAQNPARAKSIFANGFKLIWAVQP